MSANDRELVSNPRNRVQIAGTNEVASRYYKLGRGKFTSTLTAGSRMERRSEGWASERSYPYWLLFTFTAMNAAAGFATFLIFGLRFKNYHAAMWALSAGIFSAAAFHLHVLNLFNHLAIWHDRQSLNQIKFLGLVVSALSLVGDAVYGALAYKSKQEIDFGENNFVLSCISAGLSLVSGFSLFLTAKFYRKQLLQSAQQRLEAEPQVLTW